MDDAITLAFEGKALSEKLRTLGVTKITLKEETSKINDASRKRVTSLEVVFGRDIGWKKATSLMGVDASSWKQLTSTIEEWKFWFSAPVLKGVIPANLITFTAQDNEKHNGVKGPGWGIRYIGGPDSDTNKVIGTLTLTDLVENESMGA